MMATLASASSAESAPLLQRIVAYKCCTRRVVLQRHFYSFSSSMWLTSAARTCGLLVLHALVAY